MKPIIKSQQEIEIMRQGGKILAEVLRIVSGVVKAGITTKELSDFAEAEVVKRGAMPSFKDYIPEDGKDLKFPAALCVSVNDAVVHGIPDDYALQEGDVVGLDLGVEYRGYFTDAAVSIIVGVSGANPRSEEEKLKINLVNNVKACLENAIKRVRAGAHMGDISAAIQKTAENAGFSVVRDLVGHGVGKFVHEPPEVSNFGKSGIGLVLKEGMTLAIEPMICAGRHEVEMLDDNWTVVTRDGSISAHLEHTVAVTKDGCEILTN